MSAPVGANVINFKVIAERPTITRHGPR